jgi:hypothetical protein
MRTKTRGVLVTLTLLSLCLTLFVSAKAYAQAPAGPNRPANVPAGYVITPFGYFHPSCVRQLAAGETLSEDGRVLQHANGTVEKVPACAYPRYTARGEVVGAGEKAGSQFITHSWIESAGVTTTTSYGEITATWTVPPAPTSYDGQTVYFFPGLEDANDIVSIIQPVLGWNADFARAWGIASWNCCVNGTTWESTPAPVSTGDSILGTVESTCSAGTLACPTWDITTTDQTSGESTELSNSPSEGQTFNWAFAGALEVYSIGECSDYPPNGSLTFEVGLYDYNFVQVSDPNWSITDWAEGLTPQCSYGGQVAPAQVTLDYGTSEPVVGLSPTSLSWGKVVVGSTGAAKKVTLTNSGGGTLDISSIVVSGDFALATVKATKAVTPCVSGGTVAAGASCVIKVIFSPLQTGLLTGDLTFTDNAGGSPQQVSLSGAGKD